MKKIFTPLSLRTTRGRVLTLCGSFMIVFLCFAIIIYQQNRKTLLATHYTADLKYPISMAASNMLCGVEAAANSQLSFILSKDTKYQIEREKIWDTQVRTNAATLKRLSREMDGGTQTAVKNILSWLEIYSAAQQEEKKIFLANEALDPTDSTAQGTIQANQARLMALIPQIAEAYHTLQHQLRLLQTEQQKNLSDDLQAIRTDIESTNKVILIITAFIVIASILVGSRAVSTAQHSIDQATQMITELSSGRLHAQTIEVEGEMKNITKAGQVLKENLRKAVEFATAIGEGNFRMDFQPSGEHDALGHALVAMRNKLETVAEEDRKRNWSVEGLAKFAEILRSHTDVSELSNAIIQHLVNYVHANQGGLFMVEENASGTLYLKLTACFAYERRKFLQKEIAIGEGLLGQAYLEKETIYMTHLPHDYIHIKSGLGGANPKSLLVVPLKSNDKIEGVLELASFQPFQPHEIEFVEKVGETIAATLSTTKLAERSRILLEEFRQQTEQMRLQEEELRQNMEELLATQEEIERRENTHLETEEPFDPYYYPGQDENE